MKCEERKLWSEMQMALKTVVFTVVDHAKRQTEASCQEVIKKNYHQENSENSNLMLITISSYLVFIIGGSQIS